jgi:hypothetical protein
MVVVPFFLAIYRLHIFETPIGWDTPKYLWRTELAEDVGVTGLPSRVPPPVNASPDRPAFPVVALTVSSLTGIEPFRLAAIFPAAMAAAVGLAGGALLVGGLSRPWWQGALLAVALGCSSLSVRLAGPETYQDNLFAAAVVLAALVPVVRVARGGAGAGGAALLLTIAAAIHWAFFALVLAVVAATLLWRRRELFPASGTPPLRAPGTRLALIAAGSLAGAALVYLALGVPPSLPTVDSDELSRKLSDTIGRLDWLVLPLAVVGVVAVVRSTARVRKPGARFGWDVLLVWTAVAAVAVGLNLAGAGLVPAHRFLSFALPLPLFAFVGALAIGSMVGFALRGRSWSRVAGAVAVAVLLLAGAAQAQATWLDTRPYMEPRKAREAANVAAYLDRAGVPVGHPVVFVVEDIGPNPEFFVALMAHTIRTAMPPERIPHVYVYVGDPDVYLEERPDVRHDGSEHDGVAWRYFRDLRPVLASADPVAVITPAFNIRHYEDWMSRHAGSEVAPDVSVVTGPVPGAPVPSAATPVGPLSAFVLTMLAGLVLLVLFLAGLGWALALPRHNEPGERFTALAMAPAVGVAGVILAGLALDRLGLRLTGVAGASVIPIVAAGGWIAAALRTAPRRGLRLERHGSMGR